jgi:hypothetical protein
MQGTLLKIFTRMKQFAELINTNVATGDADDEDEGEEADVVNDLEFQSNCTLIKVKRG